MSATVEAVPVGALVRAKRNDAHVPEGSEGMVVRVHEASGLPVVRFAVPGGPDRINAMEPGQLEVVAGSVDTPTPLPAKRPATPAPTALRPVPAEALPAPLAKAAERVGTRRGEAPPTLRDPFPAAEGWVEVMPQPPSASFGPNGLALSATATVLLGDAVRVRLLLDRAGRRIALVPCPPTDLRGWALVRVGKASRINTTRLNRFVPVERGRQKRGGCPAAWDAERGALVVAGVPFADGGEG